MEFGLEGKRVLVTGATRGIGLATAEAFLREGCKVFLNGHDRDRLELRCRKLGEVFPGQVIPCLGDIIREDGVMAVEAQLRESADTLDIAVMNLGTGKAERENCLSVGEWRRFYEVNTLSTVSVLDVIYPFLRKNGEASVVLVSSVVARERSAAPVGYAAAKSAILTLNRYLAKTWAEDNIRVNCVLPGNIYFHGGRWEEILAMDKAGTMEYIRANVPLNRFGRPEEIADAILFLSSVRAGFITGATLNVDGGQQTAV